MSLIKRNTNRDEKLVDRHIRAKSDALLEHIQKTLESLSLLFREVLSGQNFYPRFLPLLQREVSDVL
jgi:hypothetical protein